MAANTAEVRETALSLDRLRALRHRARPDPRPADAGADDHADAYGRADYVAAITEAYVAPDARADDRADQHGRRVAAPRVRARRHGRGCGLRRVPRYLKQFTVISAFGKSFARAFD